MFIVIDGIDGSGKGTQLELVKDQLENKGKKVLILDFPRYGKQSAFMVEKYLNGDYGTNVSAKQASIFYAIDRFEASQEFTQDFSNYDYIISNRYVSASMIHQTGKITNKQEREEFLEWLDDLEFNIFGIPRPDKTIFLNVSPETSQNLVLQKEERGYLKGGKTMDLHEADKDHLQNAHASAMEVVQKNSDWVMVNCEKDNNMLKRSEITQMIMTEIL